MKRLNRTRNASTGELDPYLFPADPKLLVAARTAAAAGQTSHRVREGIIVTGDAFIASATRRDELRKDLKAAAVEMEGAAVAQVCARFGVPMIVIRGITDRANGNAANVAIGMIKNAEIDLKDYAFVAAIEGNESTGVQRQTRAHLSFRGRGPPKGGTPNG